MIRKFKNGYYTESRDADVRRGDLLAVGGVVGVLRSDYDPDLLQLEAESGILHLCTGEAEIVKLRPVSNSTKVRGYVYPGSHPGGREVG